MKSLSSHIIESLNYNFINDVLDKMSDTLDQMVQETENKWNADEKNLRPFSKYDREMTRLLLTQDLVKSFSTYCKRSDEMLDFNIYGSSKGTLTIKASVKRENVQYYLLTSVIYAGGYNIQRLHYRYLTDTNLPKDGDTSVLKEITEKIKKLSKGEKLQKEIETYEKRISNTEIKIAERERLTDSEILQTSQSYKYLIMTHNQINRESHNWKTWSNDSDGFEKRQETERSEYIADFKRSTSLLRSRDIVNWKKEIAKLEKKLDSLAS